MYEIKGRVSEEKTAHWVVEDAADVAEAMKAALDRGMCEIYAICLSKAREAFRSEDGGKWYKASVKEERSAGVDKKGRDIVKRLTYQILVQASDLDSASASLKNIMEQGYEFEACKISESGIDDVITCSVVSATADDSAGAEA